MTKPNWASGAGGPSAEERADWEREDAKRMTMIGQPGDAQNPGIPSSTAPEHIPSLRPTNAMPTARVASHDPLDRPFTRRDMLDLLVTQMGYAGNPQFVIDAMIGKWTKE